MTEKLVAMTFEEASRWIASQDRRIAALEAAGDRLAHQLLFNDHAADLTNWWNLRGGVNACTVCNPAEISVAEYDRMDETNTANTLEREVSK